MASRKKTEGAAGAARAARASEGGSAVILPARLPGCCAYFEAALEVTIAMPEGSHKLSGLVLAHVNDAEGRIKGSRIVYFVPGRGRGKKRVQPLYLPVKRCPFCEARIETVRT